MNPITKRIYELTPEELMTRLPRLTPEESRVWIDSAKATRDQAIAQGRCAFCGVDTHIEENCELKVASNQELVRCLNGLNGRRTS